MDCVERDYILEKKAAAKEFEEKKIDLREMLISDLEEKRKMVEAERQSMELSGDSMEVIIIYYYILNFNFNKFLRGDACFHIVLDTFSSSSLVFFSSITSPSNLC